MKKAARNVPDGRSGLKIKYGWKTSGARADIPGPPLWAIYKHRNTRIIANMSATRDLSSSTQHWPFHHRPERSNPQS
jgi:hypothetical protein